jgi:alpha-amylase
MQIIYSFIIVISIVAANAQHNPNFWSDRTGIVHLFEWKFLDIAEECEAFLAPKGYGGVQVN